MSHLILPSDGDLPQIDCLGLLQNKNCYKWKDESHEDESHANIPEDGPGSEHSLSWPLSTRTHGV